VKLKVDIKQTIIFYSLAKWKYVITSRQLIQLIPIINEVRVHLDKNPRSKPLLWWLFPSKNEQPQREPIGTVLSGPSFQVGTRLWLDDVPLHVTAIEVLPPGCFDGDHSKPAFGFVYTLSEGYPSTQSEFFTQEVEIC